MAEHLETQGSVYNNYSNLVLVIAVDAAAAHAWKGYDHPGHEALTSALFDGEDVTVELDRSSGVLFDMGGCGSSDVFRLGSDDLALVEHYSSDWNPEIEAQFLAVVARPIDAEGAHRIGTVEVESGVLALLHAGDPFEESDVAVAPGKARKVGCHVLLGVPNGRYAVLGELFEAKGGFGTIRTRVRIIHESSLETARAPAAAPGAPEIKSAPIRNVGRLPLPDGMRSVASLALATKPWLVLGEKSGPTIATWSAATGKLAWSKQLAERATTNVYTQKVMVSIHGDHIAAAVRDKLFILALETGAVVAEQDLGPGTTGFARMIGASSSFVRFSPDGAHVLIGQLPKVRVLDWKTGAERAVIEKCSSTYDALPSPDGNTIALPGAKLKLLDAHTFQVTSTFDIDGYATAAAFSPDGQTLALASRGIVQFLDVATGAVSRSLPPASSVRTIDVGGLAWSPRMLATASEDGYVRLWNATTCELVGEIPDHDTTIPGTGARSLNGIAFSPDGGVLFVGSAPGPTPAASAYLLEA